MVKRTLFILLIFVYILPLSVEAKLSKEEIESVGRFLAIDFITDKSSNDRKPLTNIFYVKETGENGQITENDIELIDLKGILMPGDYKTIVIINEVSGLGVLVRKASINGENQIIWNDRTSSLIHFMFKPFMGNISAGVTPLMKYKDADKISDLFKGCQVGEIPVDWKPSEADLDFYYKTIDVFYTIGIRSY